MRARAKSTGLGNDFRASPFACAVFVPYPSSYLHQPSTSLRRLNPRLVFTSQVYLYFLLVLRIPVCRTRCIRRPSSLYFATRPKLTPILDTKTASMRRSHRKSRNGCSQCKTRHIKVGKTLVVTTRYDCVKITDMKSAMKPNHNVETANVWT